MDKLHIIVDLDKCIGCFNCLMACKDEHAGNSWLPYTGEQMLHDQKWINPVKFEKGSVPYTESGYVTQMCQHCGNAPCEKARPEAIYRRADGTVLIDPQKAADPALVKACPYGQISYNTELGAAQKCTMCAHLLDQGWSEPRCVQACPLRALSVVRCSDEDFEAMAKKHRLEALHGWDCKPRIVYKNLYKYNCLFIAGSVSYDDGGTDRALCGAKIAMYVGGECVTELESDFLGEFKIHRIPPKVGAMELSISAHGFRSEVIAIDAQEDCICLPNTVLRRD